MPTLAELQARFAAALLEPDPAGEASRTLLAELCGDAAAAAAGLAIYRGNRRANFRHALAMSFPATRLVLGADRFEALCDTFATAHPASSGDLHHAAAPFPGFLRRVASGEAEARIADLAALEWAWQESLVAADAPSLDAQSLSALPPEKVPGLRLALHPAVRLVAADWPVFGTWLRCREGHPGEAPGPAGGPEQVLIRRDGVTSVAVRCDAATHAWLEALARGENLESALDAALARSAAFDVGAALRRGVREGLFAGPPQAAADSGRGRPIA